MKIAISSCRSGTETQEPFHGRTARPGGNRIGARPFSRTTQAIGPLVPEKCTDAEEDGQPQKHRAGHRPFA
jgi:hypothetical protein